MSSQEPNITQAKDAAHSCSTCRHFDGDAYCCLHSVPLKTPASIVCQDWEEERLDEKEKKP